MFNIAPFINSCKLFITLVICSISVQSQMRDTIAFQDFEITPKTPVWNYTGTPAAFSSGFSSATAHLPNTPLGIGGSRAWTVAQVSSGNPLVFDSQTITAGYDSVRVTFKLATIGADHLDYVLVSYSTDNLASFVDRIRIRGGTTNNSHWAYDATGIAKTYYLPTTETVFQPMSSGIQVAEGYSTVELVFPGNITNLALRITPRSSTSGDIWLIDNLVIFGENECTSSTSSIINPVSCNAYTSPSGKTWTTSNTYIDTIPNAVGCDSIITVNLTLNSTNSTITPTTCDTYTSPSGKVWTTSNTYKDTIPNAIGCDSIITINLTITPSTTSTINPVVCNTFTSPSGKIWTTSNTYIDTIPNAVGCDSIIMVNLTVNSTSSTISPITCDPYTSPSGKIWTTSNTYIDTIPNAIGCDSIITINLTITPSTTSTINPVVCNTFTSPSGKTWTTSNTYIDTIPNAVGCDSIITINLTVTTLDLTISVTNDSMHSNATGATYQWLDCNDNNSPISGATDQNFVPTTTGNYAVEITQNGCTDISECSMLIIVSIDELDDKNNIRIYPNPVKDNLTIEFIKVSDHVKLDISTINGELIYSNVNISETDKKVIDLSNLISGVYLITINSDTGSTHYKFIKD